MGNETKNYKFPKPSEDDFYDISEYNKAMDILDETLTDMNGRKLDHNGNASNTVTEFNQEILRENIESGEKLSVSHGKIQKWFSEMKNIAFSGLASDATQDAAHRFVTDTEKNNWNAKVSASAGDISGTKIGSLEKVTSEFPVPAEGETSKVFLGKVKKFIQDFNDFKAGIITVGKLVNNGQTTAAGYALDARYGKTLYDLYVQLNSDLTAPILMRNPSSINLDSGLFDKNKIYYHALASDIPSSIKGFPSGAYGWGVLITGRYNNYLYDGWASFQVYIPHSSAINWPRPIYIRTFGDGSDDNTSIWRYIEPKTVLCNS